jgi:hypothetical protein
VSETVRSPGKVRLTDACFLKVHTLSFDKVTSVMSTRYRYIETDGDTAAPASALEVAIDQFAIQFLSSSEAESVVNALWRGQLVAVYGEHDNIEFEPYKQDSSASFFDHLSVHRLQVPRYANVSLPWAFVPSAATDKVCLCHSCSPLRPGYSSCSSTHKPSRRLWTVRMKRRYPFGNGSCTPWLSLF